MRQDLSDYKNEVLVRVSEARAPDSASEESDDIDEHLYPWCNDSYGTPAPMWCWFIF